MKQQQFKPLYAAMLSLGLLSGGVAAPVATAAEAGLEEVVVTAQRREENLQETPLSITALGADALTDIRATDIAGISNVAPNLHIAPTIGGSVNAAINIRGAVNSNNELSRDNAVGLYLDGVPISKTSGAIFDAVDLERVEVLRGPQGTLYGKNTIGGAINLITRKPSGEFGGAVSAGIGNENLYEARAGVDLPGFGEVGQGIGAVKARLSGFYRERDGFFENDGSSSDDFDNKDQWGGRIDVRFEPASCLTIDYAYDTFDLQQNPTMLAITDSSRFTAPASALPVVRAATSKDRPDSIANDGAFASDVEIDGHTLTVAYDMDNTAIGDLTLKAISGYRELYTLSRTDMDGTQLDMFRFWLENDFEQTTHEVQLLGTTERVEYVIGAFYYEDEWDTYNPRWNFQFGRNNFDTLDRGAEDDSIAVFGQFTWTPNAFDDRLDLTAGVRWTEENKDVYELWRQYSTFSVNPSNPRSGVFVRDASGAPVFDATGNLIPLEADDSWDEVTPMGVIGWRFSDDINGYAKISTGFKSGGFDGTATTNAAFQTPFDPETLTAYEIGLKSRFADDRVQLNMAYFYNDYKDFQANQFVAAVIGTVVVNAGDAEMQGAEIELLARPTANLDLTLNYGWLDTEYTSFLVGGVDVSDQREFAYSPENTVYAAVKYTFDPFSFGTLSLRADYSWKDDHFVSITDDPTTNIDAYGLINARAELAEIPVGNGSLRFAAWGKNLDDEEYWNTALNLGVLTVNQWADPRSYGLEVGYEF
ncbi:MAG: TonB-dependent receptor [Gammaproteobacteria bacterium]|jgi:iron complex outermembrane receptor protein|nr:TonB-dependent receptor [Gammaproteobacteria bacterium]MBK9467076.1 TonB-dependent receptor [Gammaproteobacteria bacterium]MBP6479581.1 TonB-dependent receptor [Pseudomonadales bacterium]MBP7908590.1 TonB-dependent receptor [Pseudomonadales bacterium]